MGHAAYWRGSRAVADYYEQRRRAARSAPEPKPLPCIPEDGKLYRVLVTLGDGFTKREFRQVGTFRARELNACFDSGGYWLESFRLEDDVEGRRL